MALSSEDRKLFKMLKAKKKGSEGLNKEEKKQLKALKLQKAAGDEKKEAAQAEQGRKRSRPDAASDDDAALKDKSASSSSDDESKSVEEDSAAPAAKRQAVAMGGSDDDDKPGTAVAAADGPLSAEEYRAKNEIRLRLPTAAALAKPGCDKPVQSFDEAAALFPNVGVHAQRAFEQAGFAQPSPIQAQSWPLIGAGHDIISVAKTGSGKTCGFLLPAFEHIAQTVGLRRPMKGEGCVCLVLAPTRELAQQIHAEAQKFGRACGIVSCEIYGGVGKGPQIGNVKRGVHLVVATPGRMNDFLTTKCFRDGTMITNAERTTFLVLDEADRMLDMGFEPQLRQILQQLPAQHQTVMFTATWPKAVQKLAREFLRDPVQINIGGDGSGRLVVNKAITQHVYQTWGWDDKAAKMKEILAPLAEDRDTSVIIFANKKSDCDTLARFVKDQANLDAVSIHGDKEQWEREQCLEKFKQGYARAIVATDVAARGLDIKGVSHVLCFDFPMSGCEDWVHRVGRTGRAGAKGEAHTFLSEKHDKSSAEEFVRILTDGEQAVPDWLADLARRNSRGRGGKGGKGGFRRWGGGGGKGGKGGFRGGKGGKGGFRGGKGGKGGKGSRW